jgi:hypothetical protein
MAAPVPLTPPVRLDELIAAITKVHPDEPLEQLSNAVLAADHLGEVADALIGHFVDRARRSGASWTEIGASMGVTKQAVQKRFAAKVAGQADEPPLDQRQGFAAFTPDAANAVVVAQNEAAAAGNDRITPGHLVLGLLAAPGPVVPLLRELGVDVDAARDGVRGALPARVDQVPALIPFDEEAKEALTQAFAEAERRGATSVGPEHVLLALLGRSAVAGPLGDLTPEDVDRQLQAQG